MERKDEYNTFEKQLRRFRSALDFLESSGIRVATNSRLRIYERRLEHVTNDPNPYVPVSLADQVTFDLREVDELIEIAESFEGQPTHAELLRLRRLPKGHEDPDHKGDQRARDAQYELFLRAVLVSDGHPVEMEEPDLLIHYDEATVQLAAKRPTSLARLDDRLRAAVSQIDRRKEPAVIAISLDHIIRPAGRLLSVPSMGVLGAAVAALASDFVQRRAPAMANRVRGRHVGAIFLTTRIPGRTQDTNHSVLGSSLHVELLASQGSVEYSVLQQFYRTISAYLS